MPTHLSIDDHLAALRSSGFALHDAAAKAGLDASVPTCPDWQVRDLLTHQGMVHRWAAAQLHGDNSHRPADLIAEAAAAPDLLAWYSAGVTSLLTTIDAIPDGVEALIFLNDAPRPRQFWARRQAHETTIHSVDAVAAAMQRWPTAADLTIDPQVATDGVDELLHGFITRPGGDLRATPPMTMVVSAVDTGRSWTVRISDSAVTTTGGATEQPDATLSATAAQLYLTLWNRADEVTAQGQEDLLSRWRQAVRVRWKD